MHTTELMKAHKICRFVFIASPKFIQFLFLKIFNRRIVWREMALVRQESHSCNSSHDTRARLQILKAPSQW